MKKAKRWISMLLVMVFMMTVIAGCSGGATEENTSENVEENSTVAEEKDGEPGELVTSGETLRVAVQSQYCSYIIQYIIDQGWAEEEGIPLEVMTFSGGAAINEAMAANEWDVAMTGGAFIYALANYDGLLIGHQIDGSGMNVVMAREDDEVFDVQGYNSDYPDVYGSPELVKNKVLLQNTGTTAQYIMSGWLEILGMSFSDVEALSLDNTQIVTSFKAGEGDYAAVTIAGEVEKADEYGWKEVASLESMNRPLYEATICTRDAYENRYADVVKFVELMYRANDELSQSKELQIEYMSKWYEENAKEINMDSFNSYVTTRPVITSAQAKEIDLTEFASIFGQFYIDCELIEADRMEDIMNNIATDVYEDALSRFE